MKFRNIYGRNSFWGRGQITNTRDKSNKWLRKAQHQKPGLGLVKDLSAPSKWIDMEWLNPVTIEANATWSSQSYKHLNRFTEWVRFEVEFGNYCAKIYFWRTSNGVGVVWKVSAEFRRFNRDVLRVLLFIPVRISSSGSRYQTTPTISDSISEVS